MFNWLKKLLRPVITDPRAELKRDIEGIEAHINDIIEDERREAEIINLQVWMGKPIIIISNSEPFITVGFGKDITFVSKANNPVLVFEDYSSDPSGISEKINLSNCIMLYDIYKLRSLLKLNGDEVGRLFLGKYSYQSDEVESKPQEFIREPTLELYLEKMYLKRNNFAEAVKQHYEKESVR